MIRIRHLVLASIVATSVTACGVSRSDTSESSETTSAPTTRTACNASAATGSVFATEGRPDRPFTIQLPQLTGWQVTQAEGDELVLGRADQHAGKDIATVTLRVDRPLPANTSIVSAFSTDGHEWRQSRSETIDMCGRYATRVTGIMRAAGIDGADLYHEFLNSDYIAGEMLYPIRMSVQTTAADQHTYQPDIDTFVNGLQIVPIPPTG